MCECDVTVSLMSDLKVIENGETVFYRRFFIFPIRKYDNTVLYQAKRHQAQYSEWWIFTLSYVSLCFGQWIKE